MRPRYGVSFVSPKSDIYFASVNAAVYEISCYTGPHYNSTQLLIYGNIKTCFHFLWFLFEVPEILPCGRPRPICPWWRHQMETFSALLAICAGNSPVPGEFPTQRPVTRSFDVSLVCVWINGWVNNGEAGDLRCYRAHYDVTVMLSYSVSPLLIQTKGQAISSNIINVIVTEYLDFSTRMTNWFWG